MRAIGQSLEALGVIAFIMEKNGRNYIVRSDSLPDISTLDSKQSLSEKVWEVPSTRRHVRALQSDGSLKYDLNYVSWLDAQGRKKRRKRLSAQTTGRSRVSQLLRTLGKHLDRLEPHTFTISWSGDAICVDYEMADGQRVQEVLSIEKLRELTVRSRFRRARRR
ncbi:MAG TPA: hypothetical protein VH985_07105 [Candidatus Binatia bacterium]